MTPQRFVVVLQARLKLVTMVLLGVVLLTLLVNLVLPRKYTAEAAVVVDSRPSDPILGAVLPVTAANSVMATQVDIILSDGVAQRVVSQLKLDQDADLQRQWRQATDGQGSLQAWLGAQLKRHLKVLPTRESNVISISYTDRDARRAAAVANAFAQSYMKMNLGLKVNTATQYAEWFDDRTHSFRDKLAAAQDRLSKYQRAERIVSADEALDVETARLAELSSQLVVAEGQRAETRSRRSQAGAGDILPDVIDNPLIQNLKHRLSELEAERDKLALKLGPGHPDFAQLPAQINAVRAQIARETARIAGSLGSAARMDVAREADIRAALQAQEKKVLALRDKRDRVAVLQREVTAAQRDYDMVSQRLAQTSLESTMPQTNVSMLTVATPPALPSSPKLLLNTLLSLVFGGLLGVGLAFLLEHANRQLRNAGDLPELLGVPVLAILPPGAQSPWPLIRRFRDIPYEPSPPRWRGVISRIRERLPHLQAEP